MFTEGIVKYLCRKRYRAFLKGLNIPSVTQSNLRKQLFQDHLKSGYGKLLGAKKWEDLPINTFNEISPWIESSKLTHSPIKRFVNTSGSSFRLKKIPYTAELQKSFLSLFKIWAFDLLDKVLKPDIGKVFMSLSPPTNSDLKDDTDYLNSILKFILKPYVIFPSSLGERYQENVARILVREKNLGVISIWNPTYLLHIMDYIEDHRELFDDLIDKGPIDWSHLWPNLQLISCWTDGWAAGPSKILSSKLPHAILQGKGLLATEAPVTVPLHGSPAPVPLLDEVYFEFEDSAGNILTLENVQLGKVYELIISQKGGILRYRLGDKVQISGKFLNSPCLTFVGRAGNVCDMVGEKLDAITVEGIIEEVNQKFPAQMLLVPIYSTDQPCHYLLVTDSRAPYLAEEFERTLQKVYHYNSARLTGQLDQVRIAYLPNLSESLHRFYRSQGIAWGDIKDTAFISDPLIAKAYLELIFGKPFSKPNGKDDLAKIYPYIL